MKIKKFSRKFFKLEEINFIKHNNLDLCKINGNLIQSIEANSLIKRSLNIVNKYNLHNKKILFIGVPVSLQKKIKHTIKGTKHRFITERTWVHGSLTNNVDKSQKKFLEKNSKKFLKFIENPDLIVVLTDNKEKIPLKEAFKLKIPTICVGNILNSDIKSSYNVPCKSELRKKEFSLYFSLVLSTLKRGNLLKRLYKMKAHKIREDQAKKNIEKTTQLRADKRNKFKPEITNR